MVELSDGFIALPGGILNVNQFYDDLLTFMDHLVEEQFLETEHRSMILIENDPDRLLDLFEAYQPPSTDKAAWALRLSGDH